ncbi:MAG: hypothetical protein ACFFG0_56570 [Candidatus Thorarchaeota archaeon]
MEEKTDFPELLVLRGSLRTYLAQFNENNLDNFYFLRHFKIEGRLIRGIKFKVLISAESRDIAIKKLYDMFITDLKISRIYKK